MRTLTEHQVNSVNNGLEIKVFEPGTDGAPHRYEIGGHNPHRNPAASPGDPHHYVPIVFQNGPIAASGINGVTHEALLAIVADRLRAYQNGPYKCKENACALTHIEEALHWLHARTHARVVRGVEGTHTV